MTFIKIIPVVFLLTIISYKNSNAQNSTTIYTKDGEIYSACDEKLVLRGVNEMFIWSGDATGKATLSQIAKTGANATRLVWNTTGTPSNLDALIGNCLKNKMIPIPELHDATGDYGMLPICVDYWTDPEVVNIIKKYEQWVIVNIANECGDWEGTQVWINNYKLAIKAMRDAGIKAPLLIDCSKYGTDEMDFITRGQELIDYDPDHNIIFSIHVYWNTPSDQEGKKTRIDNMITSAKAKKLAFLVGEGPQMVDGIKCDNPFPYLYLIDRFQTEGISWLSWSWGGVKNQLCAPDSPFDLTTNGVYGNWLTPFAEQIMVTATNSIKNTSIRPLSLISNECAPLGTESQYATEMIDISPNPFQNKIEITGVSKDAHCIVYSLLGKKIMEGNPTSIADLSSLEAGMYFINITDDNNRKSIKIIKE